LKEAFNIGGGEQDGKVPVYPLDISNPAVLDYLKSVFKYAVEHYNVKYLKLDFLVRSLMRSNEKEDIITYPGEYCAAVYRNFIREIRSVVGDEVFILGCGAPIGECIGIMDAMRISPDITWGEGTEGHPGYWNLIRWNTGNVLLRSFYHRKVFLNDPDGLVLRDYKLDGDDFCSTPDEARVWATTVALSGGAIILNEDLLRLSRDRLELFKEIIPPFGEAAKPLDFFEQPLPSTSYISLKGTQTVSRIIAVYNWEDKTVDRSIELGRLGISRRVFAVDCWKKEIAGVYSGSIGIKSLRPHSVEAFLLREIGNRPMLLFCDNNFYLGTDRLTGEYKEEKDELVIDFHGPFQEQTFNMYIYLPEGYETDGVDYTAVWTEYGSGRVIKVVTPQLRKQKRIIFTREDKLKPTQSEVNVMYINRRNDFTSDH
jgi:alpha-galactosidase